MKLDGHDYRERKEGGPDHGKKEVGESVKRKVQEKEN